MNGAFIDWVSFTVPLVTVSTVAWGANIEASIDAVLPGFLDILKGQWEQGKGRAPYIGGFSQSGITVFFHPTIDHVLVEITGQGCAHCGHDLLLWVLERTQSRLTRIDVARDHKGYCIPSYVLKKTPVGRFKSRSLIESDTGVTAYVGSRKSGQFIRVYRYRKPHPRANVTRVEYVARAKIGKAVCAAVLCDGVDRVYASVVDRFALPACVGSDASLSEFRVERAGRKDSKTMMWLISSVVPAMRRLIKSGELDLNEFVETHLS